MPIKYDELMQAKETGLTTSYGDRETMLYALGIGFMRDPKNKDELKIVYENDLQTDPTMATVLVWRTGSNYLMVEHGDHRRTTQKQLPNASEFTFDERSTGVFDMGNDNVAVILM